MRANQRKMRGRSVTNPRSMTRLAQNLGMLCRSQRSVSEVCRRIGINRQQFGRYLSGAGRPSAHNLQRICDYFGITEADLLLEPAALREKLRAQPKGHGSVAGVSTLDRALRGAFPGDVRLLRRYVGLYHYYFRSPTWPGRIVRGLVQLREQNGLIRSRSVTRARNRGDGMQYRSLYEGLATMLHNQIFLVEVQKTALDAVVETILYPAARSRGAPIRGVTFGVSFTTRAPYMVPIVWQPLGPAVRIRDALNRVGVFSTADARIDRTLLAVLDGSGAGPVTSPTD